jgi:hypothetical protein
MQFCRHRHSAPSDARLPFGFRRFESAQEAEECEEREQVVGLKAFEQER